MSNHSDPTAPLTDREADMLVRISETAADLAGTTAVSYREAFDAIFHASGLLAEARAEAWDEALELAGDESQDLRVRLFLSTSWDQQEKLLWDHLIAMQKANPYRKESTDD